MKVLFYIIITILIAACIIFVLLYLDYRSELALPRGSIFVVEKLDDKYKIKMREAEKEALKLFFNKVLKMVYYEATIHNPPGDVVPDSLDDALINNVKERVE